MRRVTFALFLLLSLIGSASAAPAVEIIELGGYGCPFTRRAEATLAELKTRYGDQLAVRFMHMPLPFHVDAEIAARAGEAARRQGKHDQLAAKMFAHQDVELDFEDPDADPDADRLTPERLTGWARELGLDVNRFKADLDSAEVQAIVTRDARIAAAVGATGTPTFFVNGVVLRGAQPVEKFVELIEPDLAEGKGKGPDWIATRTQSRNAALYDYVYGGKTPPPPEAVKAPSDLTIYQAAVDPARDIILGNPLAPVTLVEFFDYECPFSRRLEPTLDSLRGRYGDDVRLVLKQNPLPFHKQARPAAAAAICAWQQSPERFEAMHDALMAAEPAQLVARTFIKRAGELGLDEKKLRACLSAPATEAHIRADQELAGEITARGTPNMFINGRKVTGAKPEEDIAAVIDQERARAKAVAESGVAPADLYARIIRDGKRFLVLEEQVFTFSDEGTAILGKPDAPIRVTVFADLQCPFSKRVFPVLAQLVKAQKGRVAVAFKHFPLSFHTAARPAAEAAQCAREQGRFWEYTTAAYASEDLEAFLSAPPPASTKVKASAHAACIARADQGPTIERHMTEGRDAGVRGTPTIYIQGRKWNSTSGYDLETIKAAFDKL